MVSASCNEIWKEGGEGGREGGREGGIERDQEMYVCIYIERERELLHSWSHMHMHDACRA